MDFLKPADINAGVEEFRATPGARLVDVRTPGEYAGGHIPGAANVPLQQISAIASDLRQIPMHLANEKLPGLSELLGNPDLDDGSTLYEQAGIEISFKYANGSNQVVNQLQSGEADFGVAAQPAVIIYDINNGLTKA